MSTSAIINFNVEFHPASEIFIVVNPATKIYVTVDIPIENSEIVSLEGVVLHKGTDYTVTNNSFTIDNSVTLTASDKIRIQYIFV